MADLDDPVKRKSILQFGPNLRGYSPQRLVARVPPLRDRPQIAGSCELWKHSGGRRAVFRGA